MRSTMDTSFQVQPSHSTSCRVDRRALMFSALPWDHPSSLGRRYWACSCLSAFSRASIVSLSRASSSFWAMRACTAARCFCLSCFLISGSSSSPLASLSSSPKLPRASPSPEASPRSNMSPPAMVDSLRVTTPKMSSTISGAPPPPFFLSPSCAGLAELPSKAFAKSSKLVKVWVAGASGAAKSAGSLALFPEEHEEPSASSDPLNKPRRSSEPLLSATGCCSSGCESGLTNSSESRSFSGSKSKMASYCCPPSPRRSFCESL
mmetsp:Transcript_10753/g.27164  ORF Transcript_10753/g.27164 Transcript_10753/m.27164 type:complete len:263 (+) Transcript_10753:969-1757(+)